MTRIFGFEKHFDNTHTPNGVNVVLDNLQEAVSKTYEKGWQACGMGFIVVNGSGGEGFSVYKGYRGIGSDTNIRNLIPDGLQLAVANNPTAFFGVLQNYPDNGYKEFKDWEGKKFPMRSENWLGITMGWWGNNGYSDEQLPWYNKERPAYSILNYLETHPDSVNFDWIDLKRTPFIVAIKKDASQICIVDSYTGNNEKGLVYVKNNYNGLLLYQGVRDSEGKQV